MVYLFLFWVVLFLLRAGTSSSDDLATESNNLTTVVPEPVPGKPLSPPTVYRPEISITSHPSEITSPPSDDPISSPVYGESTDNVITPSGEGPVPSDEPEQEEPSDEEPELGWPTDEAPGEEESSDGESTQEEPSDEELGQEQPQEDEQEQEELLQNEPEEFEQSKELPSISTIIKSVTHNPAIFDTLDIVQVFGPTPMTKGGQRSPPPVHWDEWAKEIKPNPLEVSIALTYQLHDHDIQVEKFIQLVHRTVSAPFSGFGRRVSFGGLNGNQLRGAQVYAPDALNSILRATKQWSKGLEDLGESATAMQQFWITRTKELPRILDTLDLGKVDYSTADAEPQVIQQEDHDLRKLMDVKDILVSYRRACKKAMADLQALEAELEENKAVILDPKGNGESILNELLEQIEESGKVALEAKEARADRRGGEIKSGGGWFSSWFSR